MSLILKIIIRLALIPVVVWIIQLIIAFVQGIREGIETDRKEISVKENIFGGIVGAVIGALIGSALWIVLGQVGFIAGIAGYAIVFCSIRGYKLLGRCVSKRGIVICVIFSVLMILAAEYVSTGIVIYQAFKEEYYITVMDAIKLVPEFLKESEIRNELLKNLAVGYGLAIWASYSPIKNMWRTTQPLIVEPEHDENKGTDKE